MSLHYNRDLITFFILATSFLSCLGTPELSSRCICPRGTAVLRRPCGLQVVGFVWLAGYTSWFFNFRPPM
ncbi:hypothetical protein C8F01DRAFT_1180357 [Mycena amicta]|nr:hypothetical protein C8F01DRAFT_1180357 [Mycena amicta]